MKDFDQRALDNMLAASDWRVALAVLFAFVLTVVAYAARECGRPDLADGHVQRAYDRVLLVLFFVVTVSTLLYAVFWAFLAANGRCLCG